MRHELSPEIYKGMEILVLPVYDISFSLLTDCCLSPIMIINFKSGKLKHNE